VVVTTDTAFALALLGIFASNLPRSVRVLLLAFAAVDDIGGLLVIAIVYTSSVSWAYLGAAAALILVIHVLRRFEIIASIPYVLLGIAVLLLVQASGVHSTIAGVILGALVPVYPRVPESHFAQVVQHQVDGFQRAHQSATGATDPERRQNAVDKQEAQLGQLSETAHATYETAQRITHAINPWISYVVLPLFALSNAGVVLSHEVIHGAMSNTLALGVIAGLLLGKPVGVLAFAFAAVRTGLAKIPEGVTWPMLSAVSVSSGIGFTISLFISDLAYANRQMADEAKVGVLCASVLASVAGYVMFRWAVSRQEGLPDSPEGRSEGGSAEPPPDGAQEEIHAGPLEGASGAVRNLAREDAGKRKK
jgi:NhaA family Na+:H+ antiporter